MAKFSLREGVFDAIHVQINPGQLPLGSALDAQEKSKNSHKYSLPPNCEGETCYMKILERMVKFLHPMEKLPIFFTDGSTINDQASFQETKKVVKKIFFESQEDDILADIKIFPMDELLYQLQMVTVDCKNRLNGTNEPKFPSVVYAADKFNHDNSIEFCYTSGCDFHEKEDASKDCCLSKVRRFGYIIAKWCSNPTKYELISGKHYPENYIPKGN